MSTLLALALMFPFATGFVEGRYRTVDSPESIGETPESDRPSVEALPSAIQNELTVKDIFNIKSLYSSLDGYQCFHASSYDLDGGNQDGLFFEKQEDIASTATMLDVNGPGVMTSFWAAGYSEHVAKEVFHFYIDGQLLFSAKHEDLFGGKVAPFVKPYVGVNGDSGGGCYFYVPILFQKSLKITAEYLNYYNIDYVLLPSNSKIHSTTLNDGLILPSYFNSANGLADRCQGEINEGERLSLNPGETATLLDQGGNGIIEGFTLSVDGISDAKAKAACISATGRWVKAGGHISFNMDVRPDNEGCYLKYRIDAIWSNQVVDVYCDNIRVTTIDSGAGSSDYRIRDCVAKIPSEYTAGKSRVNIRLECLSTSGIDLPFFDVWLYSIIPGGSICSDFIDILNGSSEADHQFEIVGQNGSGSVNASLSDATFAVDLKNYPFQSIGALPAVETGYYSNVISMSVSVSGLADVQLRRQERSQQATSVAVWVGGKKVGTWNSYDDGSDKIRENSFTIPKEQVAGKTAVVLNFVPLTGSNNIASLFCYESGVLKDFVNVADDTTHSISGTLSFKSSAIDGVNSLSDSWEASYEQMKNACDYDSLVLDSVLTVFTSQNDIPDFSLPLSVLFNMGVYGFSKVEGYCQGMNEDGLGYFYLPMPYQDGIRIVLSRDSKASGALSCVFSYAEEKLDRYDSSLMTLKAQNHRGTSVEGTPLPWLSVTGSGKLVGLQYNCTGASSFDFLEGDEIISVDGNKSPMCNGTGTEDIFESAWYFVSGKFTQGMHGLTWKDYSGNNRARISAYRSYLTDQIVFRNGIEATIEHGASNTTSGEEYDITAFYYSNDKSAIHSLGTYSSSGDNPDCRVVSGTADEDEIAGRLEGNSIDVNFSHTMRCLNGKSELTIAIPASNNGIMIRRLYDLRNTEQKAEVYCDGAYINTWMNKYNRGERGILRYDDFIIPSEFTAGKTTITIDFVSVPGFLWEESDYQCFSLGYDFDPDYALQDTDGDGLADRYDDETIVKGVGLDLVYSYRDALEVKAYRKSASLTESQKSAVLSLCPNTDIIDSFDVELLCNGMDYVFPSPIGIRSAVGNLTRCTVIFIDTDGSINIQSNRTKDGFTIFSARQGGRYLVLAQHE